MRRTLALLSLAAGTAFAQDRLPMQDDLWREFDLYRTRLLDLARSIPDDKFDFRPASDVRSIKEVVLHVGLNNYMLLDMMGRAVPDELYPNLPQKQPDRMRTIAQTGGKLEKSISGKEKVIAIVTRAFAAVDEPIKSTSAAGLNAPAMFFDRKTSMGGLQLRAVAHLHEHLGQLIAYARSVGVVPPWSQ